jgi:RimJ/RimL family protein N-acetyltransferase
LAEVPIHPDDGVWTDRMVLRPITLDDVDQLVALDSDPEVMRYLTGDKPSSRPEVEQKVRQVLGWRWMAYDRMTGQFVGWFGARPTGESEHELGYRLPRRAWGQGLATEGTLALINTAFARSGVTRLWAQTMAVNSRSRRVMERCGLKYVRTFHLDWDDPIEGTEHGEVEYEILRPDWQERQPLPSGSPH